MRFLVCYLLLMGCVGCGCRAQGCPLQKDLSQVALPEADLTAMRSIDDWLRVHDGKEVVIRAYPYPAGEWPLLARTTEYLSWFLTPKPGPAPGVDRVAVELALPMPPERLPPRRVVRVRGILKASPSYVMGDALVARASVTGGEVLPQRQ